MILLYKQSALSPIEVQRSNTAIGLPLAVLGAPSVWNMFGKPFFKGDTIIDKGIRNTYGKIPGIGEMFGGGPADKSIRGLEKVKDPTVRTQLMRTKDGIFSTKGTMHGRDAVRNYMKSNITVSPEDMNNPLFKNIRKMQHGDDTRLAYQNAVEDGRAFNINTNSAESSAMNRMLSKRDRREVKKQQDEFLNAAVGGGMHGWD